MELHFLFCSVVFSTLVVGGASYSALPRYNHLHHFRHHLPATHLEPSSKETPLNATNLNTRVHESQNLSQGGVDFHESLPLTRLEHFSEQGDEELTAGSKSRLEALLEAYKQAGENGPLHAATPEDVVFQLFTRESGLSYERLEADKPNSINKSSFDASKRTVAIIHGFLEDADISPWMKAMRDWFLDQEDVNVILVQWAKLADHLLNYYQVAQNARMVGAELGRLLSVIQTEQGLSAESVYLIGFSLGAHAAGVAGQSFRGIGRITGLDPAGPAFEDKGINMRLDHTDAQFVDVIHTNYGPLIELHFGYKESLGHVDHYVNGGRIQPGCKSVTFEAITKFFEGDLRDFHPCNHERAYLYYIESLVSSRPASSFQCPNYSTFVTGACLRNHANIFGLGVKPNMPGVYYMETQSEHPYLSRHLEVTVTVGQVKKTTTGELDLMAYVMDRTTVLQRLARSHNFGTGQELKTMLVLPQHLPLSAVPTQLQFSKSTLYIMRPNSLSIAKLQLVEAELDLRSYQGCNVTLKSRVWQTVSPTTLECGQAAPY